MTQVLAQAIVDPGTKAGRFVTVAGYIRGADPKSAQRRIYIIDAKTDTLAAEEGIRRFCAELEGDGDGAI